MNPGPIVSLLPAATEMVCALGAGPRLVGRSHECDYPPWVTRLPALTHPRLDPHAPPALLDRTVRELVRQAASLYAVDDGALAAVRPQVIVTQTQCEGPPHWSRRRGRRWPRAVDTDACCACC